jgi:hypothetical protein
MKTIKVKNGYIKLARIDFCCPHCQKQHNDRDEKYLRRCNRNKSGYTVIKCQCGKSFGMTYNYMGDAVGFYLQ